VATPAATAEDAQSQSAVAVDITDTVAANTVNEKRAETGHDYPAPDALLHE
jgi:hypothetical protein